MEVAFQAKLKANDAGEVVLDSEWFSKRLEDCKCCCNFPPESPGCISGYTHMANSQRCSQATTA
jgi:hypothetical protein